MSRLVAEVALVTEVVSRLVAEVALVTGVAYIQVNEKFRKFEV